MPTARCPPRARRTFEWSAAERNSDKLVCPSACCLIHQLRTKDVRLPRTQTLLCLEFTTLRSARKVGGISDAAPGIWEFAYASPVDRYGTLAIVVFDGPGAETFLQKMATSREPFDRWLRERISEYHAIDFSQPDILTPAELFLDWQAPRHVYAELSE